MNHIEIIDKLKNDRVIVCDDCVEVIDKKTMLMRYYEHLGVRVYYTYCGKCAKKILNKEKN